MYSETNCNSEISKEISAYRISRAAVRSKVGVKKKEDKVKESTQTILCVANQNDKEQIEGVWTDETAFLAIDNSLRAPERRQRTRLHLGKGYETI